MLDKREKTANFIEQVNTLLATKYYRNKRQIVEKLGWDESAFSSVIAGRRFVPDDKAIAMDKLFKSAKITPDSPLESAQDKYIKSLEETVALQKEMIQILKERLGIK